MEIIVGVLIIVIVGALAFLTRANWGSRMGKGLGERYMNEFGMNDDPRQNDRNNREGEKRE